MTEQGNEGGNSIDAAIDECANYISSQNSRAGVALQLLFSFLVVALTIAATFIFFFGSGSHNGTPAGSLQFDAGSTGSSLPTTLAGGAFLFFSILIGVAVSTYRFHMSEIARTEHYKLGFMRIRIAANNSHGGFATEVRQSLTVGAFEFESRRERVGRIRNPLEGHPTADITTAFLNKLLDAVEVVPKKT